MDLYSINDLDNNREININDLKNSYYEYGPNASAITQNVKISNPPKKYDYSKWVKKTNKKDLQFLLASPSVSVLPNRSKYSDLASTFVEFNLLVFKKADIILYLDANGFDDYSKYCLVSCDIPESELYFGNDISSYVSKVQLSENKISEGVTFNLEQGLHKIRVHIGDDGFYFRSIMIDERNFESATFISKKYQESKNSVEKSPKPGFASYSRNLMEIPIEEEKPIYNPTQEEIINGHLNNINDKLDNLILQNIESKESGNSSKKILKKEPKNSDINSNSNGIILNQYITENVKSYKNRNKKIINNATEEEENDSELMFKVSDDTSENLNFEVKKKPCIYKTYNFYMLVLILFILFFIFINEDSSVLPFVSTPIPSPEFLNSSTEF